MTTQLVAVQELADQLRRAALADMAMLHAAAFSPAWSAEEITALLDHPGAVAFLAREDCASAGFVLARAAADEAEVLTIVTRTDTRRRGHARALLHAIIAVLKARGTSTLHLEVAEDNHAARALYAAAGFAAAGRRKAYYARPGAPAADALLLRKTLA